MSGDKKEEAQKDPTMMEKLLRTRTLTLFDEVNAKTARELVNSLTLLEADDKEKPITLLLNSPGGEVSSGFAIYDTIRFLQCPVRIIATGMCASIATIIMLAAEKENRLSMPNATFLIHQPLGGASGSISDVEIAAREIAKIKEKLLQLLAKETGQSYERISKDADRDFYMNAGEAKEYGLVSRIIEHRSEIK